MRHVVLIALLTSPLLAQDRADPASMKAEAARITKRLHSKEADERIAGLREAAGNQESSLTIPIAKLLKAKNPAVRTAAIEALAARENQRDKKRAALALASRLGPLSDREDERPELDSVIQALHDLAQPATIKSLLDIKSGTDRSLIRARAIAVGNVPSKEAIERLIQFGYKDRRGADRTRDSATAALAYATQQKVRGGIEGWRRWWKENEKTFDFIAAAEKRAENKAARAKKQERRKKRKKKKGAGE